MAVSVLVITREFDPTTDYVITRLHDRGVPVFRFDLADFPLHVTLSGRLSSDTSQWRGTLATKRRRIDLAEVTAVWYRKPTRFRMAEAMTATEEQWALTEAKHGFGGLLAALRCRWVNHPHRNAAATKPHQLTTMATCGLTVPDTLITNEAGEARAFCAAHPDGAIYKPFQGAPNGEGGQVVALYATPVTAEAITDAVGGTVHLFQEAVHKSCEVRLTVVGDRLFGLRIDTTTPAGKQDWRADHNNLRYSVIDVPESVAAGVHATMNYFGLVFAAFDFAVTPSGEWVAFELNANGQWAWDHPLRDAIADAITDELTGDTA